MREFLSTLLFAALALIAGGCAKSPSHRIQEHKTQADSTMAGEQDIPTLRTDSFTYSMKGDWGSCDVYIDYPVEGPREITTALRGFVQTALFEHGTSTNAPSEMVRRYCQQRKEAQEKLLERMELTSVREAEQPEEGIDVRKVCVTDAFVTYEVYRYSYITHGAHGEYTDYGATFRMSDGHRLGNVLSHVDEALYDHVRKGLKAYFEINSDQQLQEICTTDLELMPMPSFPPYLMRDGVRLHYAIFDICPFDWGDPVVTIPYEVAMPYLTEEAKALVTP